MLTATVFSRGSGEANPIMLVVRHAHQRPGVRTGAILFPEDGGWLIDWRMDHSSRKVLYADVMQGLALPRPTQASLPGSRRPMLDAKCACTRLGTCPFDRGYSGSQLVGGHLRPGRCFGPACVRRIAVQRSDERVKTGRV